MLLENVAHAYKIETEADRDTDIALDLIENILNSPTAMVVLKNIYNK